MGVQIPIDGIAPWCVDIPLVQEKHPDGKSTIVMTRSHCEMLLNSMTQPLKVLPLL